MHRLLAAIADPMAPQDRDSWIQLSKGPLGLTGPLGHREVTMMVTPTAPNAAVIDPAKPETCRGRFFPSSKYTACTKCRGK